VAAEWQQAPLMTASWISKLTSVHNYGRLFVPLTWNGRLHESVLMCTSG
jgi:hypothetical protein